MDELTLLSRRPCAYFERTRTLGQRYGVITRAFLPRQNSEFANTEFSYLMKSDHFHHNKLVVSCLPPKTGLKTEKQKKKGPKVSLQ
jgi:hypothetical protein